MARFKERCNAVYIDEMILRYKVIIMQATITLAKLHVASQNESVKVKFYVQFYFMSG